MNILGGAKGEEMIPKLEAYIFSAEWIHFVPKKLMKAPKTREFLFGMCARAFFSLLSKNPY